MTDVFLLHHRNDLGDGEEDVKLIGIYTSRAGVEAAQARVARQPGFAEAPDGFEIHAHRLDTDDWREGYVTVRD